MALDVDTPTNDQQENDVADEILGGGSGQTVSAWESPEMASAMSAEAVVGPKPRMENDWPNTVDLPGGYVDEGGMLHSTAIVRELTGKDEERLSKVDSIAKLPIYLQTMINCGVESIGSYPAEPEMLKRLLVGDREMLILGIRIATYGPNVDMHIVCPACGAEEDIVFEVDKDIPIRKMEEPSKREYEVKLHGGDVAIITPVTVAMHDETWDIKKSPAEIKTAVLSRAVIMINGIPMTYDMAQNLGMGQRKMLLEALADLQPGPDYGGVRLPCGTCDKEFPLRLDLTDLFR